VAEGKNVFLCWCGTTTSEKNKYNSFAFGNGGTKKLTAATTRSKRNISYST